MTPYTPKEDIANNIKTLILESTNTVDSVKGIKAQATKLKENDTIGDKIKIKVFAVKGNIVSFTNNFKASAKGCNNPKYPTTLGPLLRCIIPNTLRSNKVK